MRPAPHRNSVGQELPYAWERWSDLQTIADSFLSLSEVQQALRDETYRLGEFQKRWKRAPENLPAAEVGRRYDGQSINDFASFASILRAMANQTQKLLAKKGAPTGMREMTKIQEWMNLLLEGDTLRSSFELVDHYVPETSVLIEGLRIHVVMAIEVMLRVTKGALDEERQDSLVTKAHGLYVITSHGDTRVSLPPINMVGSKSEIFQGYSYGNAEGHKIKSRIQGAEFRLIQMREFGTEMLPSVAAKSGWKKPSTRLFSTVIGSEVCTESALSNGMSPTFFEGQWQIGLRAPVGETIDFRRGNVRQQIEKAIPHIGTTLLHYPTDNPVIQSK